MSFLIEQIKEQKILEMEVNFDDFIKENNISESAMIHSMVFDKDVFKEEKEVREYLKDKYMWNPDILESDSHFTAILLAHNQIDQDTEVEVELRRGILAIAGDLLPVMVFDEFQFNEKGEVNLSSKFGTLNLSEGLPHIIEIARVAEGEHPSYGKLRITQEHLESMETNFNSKVTGVDLSVNEDHKKNEAFGWFKDVFLSFDKQTLYGQVQWNTKGTQALSEKEYRYFSPEFRFNYVHPHDMEKKEHGATLLGGALTNYPFLKMEAITELSNKQQQGEQPVKENTIDLSEHTAKVVELSGKITEIQGKLDVANQSNVELNGKVTELTTQIETGKKEKVHNKLFTDNKINKAQLVALNEGKDYLEVLSLTETMTTEPAGNGDAPKVIVELSDKDRAVAKALDLTDEEFSDYNQAQ